MRALEQPAAGLVPIGAAKAIVPRIMAKPTNLDALRT